MTKLRRPSYRELERQARAADAAEIERLISECGLHYKTAQTALVVLAVCGYDRAAAFVVRNSLESK